ncbi:hypothetical protein CFO_g494 [Ceratocystis platani]|uniref:Uncharacterized protein n=1 Tax=Ceratocystis fimbriata f. sp. platani TaxID=88771 RepID=A0A0F8BXA3_CERFI|nr:hypothetical protein CFO_g494 [Ceratocystis platani]
MSEARAPKPPLLKPRFYLHVDFGIDWIQKEATTASSSSSHQYEPSQPPSKSKAHSFFTSRARKNRKPELLQRRTRSLDEMYPDPPGQPASLDLSTNAQPAIFPYPVLPLTPGDLNARDPLTGYYAPDESATSGGLVEPMGSQQWEEGLNAQYYQPQHQQQQPQHQQRSASSSRSPRHLPATSRDYSRIDSVADLCYPSNLVPGNQPQNIHLTPDPFQELFLSSALPPSPLGLMAEGRQKSPSHLLPAQRPPPPMDKKLPALPPIKSHGHNDSRGNDHSCHERYISALISPLSEYIPSPISPCGSGCAGSRLGSACSSPAISPLMQPAMLAHGNDNTGSLPSLAPSIPPISTMPTASVTDCLSFKPGAQPHLQIRPVRSNTYPEDKSLTAMAALDEQQSPTMPVASNAAEMMALSSAMMTVDSGFEDKRWNWSAGP